jgi:hypothetical protein
MQIRPPPQAPVRIPPEPRQPVQGISARHLTRSLLARHTECHGRRLSR